MITWFLEWCWWHGRYGTVVGESLSIRNHSSLNNTFELLLLITLTSPLLMFSGNLCPYILLLIKDGWIQMVCTWSFSRGYCNIPLSTTHCCSNVSIEITEQIASVVILDLIHLAAWLDLPSFIEHIYNLPTGGNILGVLKFNLLVDVETIRCERWLGVEMVEML